MEKFLKKSVENNMFELEIDTGIFSQDIILRSAFQYLDLGYFFFKNWGNTSIILQFSPKQWVEKKPEIIIWEFSDTLLEMLLRVKLENDNKIIRESIVTKAINWPLDSGNFVSLDSQTQSETNQIDFDRDIDEILKEIENDPDLQIDTEEVNKILEEIEEETESEIQKPWINLNVGALDDVKNKFKNN